MYIIKQLLFEQEEQQEAPEAAVVQTQASPATKAPAVVPALSNSESGTKASSKSMSADVSGFPSLVPAIVTKVHIGDVNPLGKSRLASTRHGSE